MLRALLGVLKGGLVGAAIGVGATRMGLAGSTSAWLVYGLVGFLAGVVCGKPIWRQATLWTPVLKGVVGIAVCLGLYWLARKGLGGFVLPFGGAPDTPLVDRPLVLAPLLGIVYGLFIEIDDGGPAAGAPATGGGKSVPPPAAGDPPA